MATRKAPTWALISRDSAADTTGDINKVGVINAAGKIARSGAAAPGVRGIIIEGAAAGRGATLQYAGQGTGIAGGTFAADVSVTSDAAGLVVAATTGQPALGWSLSAGAAGVVAELLLHPHTAP